jgi:hypothetical protein
MTEAPTLAAGNYGFQIAASFMRSDPAAHWRARNGVPMAMQYLYGSVRAADGTYWWPIRGAFAEKARFLHLPECRPGADFHWDPVGEKSYSGPVVHEERDGRWGVWLPDASELMSTDGPTVTWNEQDALSIQGSLVSDTVLQFFCPDEQEPLAYTSRLFRASGTVKGTPVSGLIFHDSMHMPAGVNFILSSYLTKLEAAWVAFATEYDDGSIDTGHLIWGTEGFTAMIVDPSRGERFVARDIECEVQWSPKQSFGGDWPSRVVYRGGGETWIWEELPQGGARCPIRTDLPDGHRWVQGWVHREGETRTPVCTEALMETYNPRLADVTVH